MEETGERSPDEMLDRVRADYMDMVLHPEKGQSYLLLQRLKNQIAIEAQQAGMAAQEAAMQMAQMRGTPPGGAPGAGTPDQQAGAASQARTQAAQQAAPVKGQDQNAPATGPNSEANSTKVGTLVQDGRTFNRIVTQGEM
jgi:pyruvate/2-oxoglutarate dehydrogenase complex dihydrolipoamide acyltransferase (E2) component